MMIVIRSLFEGGSLDILGWRILKNKEYFRLYVSTFGGEAKHPTLRWWNLRLAIYPYILHHTLLHSIT